MRTNRKVLAAMLLAAAPLCCSRPAVSAAWSDLWRTPDQQGQALLDAGRAAQAADRFQDPRRRAYADLEAGRNQDAATLLAPFTDAQSEYNRGNALAKAGQLQAALAAYNAALRQSPNDKDIRHNRDLVERALRRQQQSPQSSSRNGGQSGRQSGSSGQQQQQSSSGQHNGSGSQQSGAGGQQSGAGGQQSADSGRTAANGSQPGASRPGSPNQQQPGESSADASKEAPGQAQHDAEEAAALARQQRRGAAGNTGQAPGARQTGPRQPGSKDGDKESGADSLLARGSQTPRQKPETERQLALDQWLRQIPDSPAGLLQRKFLIEHMMRQQDNGEQPQESGP